MSGLFGKKGRNETEVLIIAEDICVYRGLLEEFPIDEDVMIRKSIEFYNDPKPCYIHRGAVRQKLAAELAACFQNGKTADSAEGLEKLREYMACREITGIRFS